MSLQDTNKKVAPTPSPLMPSPLQKDILDGDKLPVRIPCSSDIIRDELREFDDD